MSPVLPQHYILPTVRVIRKADKFEVDINESDFDEKLHKLVEIEEEVVEEEVVEKGLEDMTAKELRAYAAEKFQVELAKSLSKAKLQAAIADLENG